jgi:hypothetical protein
MSLSDSTQSVSSLRCRGRAIMSNNLLGYNHCVANIIISALLKQWQDSVDISTSKSNIVSVRLRPPQAITGPRSNGLSSVVLDAVAIPPPGAGTNIKYR